ncbi:MAG: NAD(P)H-hydrate dehydratase [Brevundimonas sp.]|nr:NAD(P)H-hydrate dehydratase [Brevundimonas sp.]
MTVALLDADLLAGTPLPKLSPNSDKEERGAVLVVAGGGGVPGAPVLTGRAALRAGAGKLQVVSTLRLLGPLGAVLPEAAILCVPETRRLEIALPSRPRVAALAAHAGSVVVGPGMAPRKTPRRFARSLMEAWPFLPIVVDAAALPLPSEAEVFSRLANGRVVLTPHAGEMARLLDRSRDTVLADPLAMARDAASRLRSVVVMKGAATFVATPSGLAWRHLGGVAGLATSGSGDVLAGLIAGLMARGASPLQAAQWGVYLHAAAGRRLAADLGALGFLASELPDQIPGILDEVDH